MMVHVLSRVSETVYLTAHFIPVPGIDFNVEEMDEELNVGSNIGYRWNRLDETVLSVCVLCRLNRYSL